MPFPFPLPRSSCRAKCDGAVRPNGTHHESPLLARSSEWASFFYLPATGSQTNALGQRPVLFRVTQGPQLFEFRLRPGTAIDGFTARTAFFKQLAQALIVIQMNLQLGLEITIL